MATDSTLQAKANRLRVWDPNKMFDVSEAQQRAVAERAAMRLSKKKEFQMKVTSPHRGVNGYIFDPAVQRYLSMRSTPWEQFKPTHKNFAYSVLVLWGPLFLLSWYSVKTRGKREHSLRTGQVSYADREAKFV